MPMRKPKRNRRLTLAAVAATALVGAGLSAFAMQPAWAATSLPCDIFASAGTPCVAAHSTTRALFAAYNGPLYQVRRSSDSHTLNINVLSAGGYANIRRTTPARATEHHSWWPGWI